MDLFFQVLLIVCFIFLNGFFVLSEFSLVSVRRTRIEELARSGHRGAKLVLSALNDLSTYISATQFGITLVSLALGWLGEPALAHVFAIILEPHMPLRMLFISSHAIAIATAFIVITFLQIIFGELAPKTTALQKSEKLVFLIITPLMAFTTLFKPFIWFLSASSGFLLSISGIAEDSKRTVHTEEEIKLILSQSAKSGEIDQQEVDIIYRVFKIGDLPISTIMVPKKDVIAFGIHTGIQEIAKDITEENLHTRFPIYERNLENVKGYVSVTDMYVFAKTLHQDKKVGETDLIRKIMSINENKRIDNVLSLMKKTGVHLAIITNASGKMVGLVSIEDIIESLVGELEEQE